MNVQPGDTSDAIYAEVYRGITTPPPWPMFKALNPDRKSGNALAGLP
jgi:hypothetical protein